MVSHKEHVRHLAEALEKFYDQHGDCCRWTKQEWEWHDKLVSKINKEDGRVED